MASTSSQFKNKGSVERTALIEMAIHAQEQAEELTRNIRKMVQARENEKGKGIYVDGKGRPYAIDDPLLDEAIKADREATAEANQYD
jgi:hypothetical protein